MSEAYAKNGRRFSFGGHSCTEFGMIASGVHTFNAPERDLERISIPGRNGDLFRDNGRFKNITVSYPVAIFKDFAANAEKARRWLLSDGTYKRLTDGYNPEYFRLGVFIGPVNFDMKLLNRVGEVSLMFDCKPQRFLISGETPLTFYTASTLKNDYFPALPLIRVYGSGDGTVTVGDTTVKVFDLDGSVTLDCELQNAYQENGDGAAENWNNHIYAPEFPTLQPGSNAVSWTGGVSRLEITPRWWTL